MSSTVIQSQTDLDAAFSANGGLAKSLLFFWASWHETSKLNGPLHDIVNALAQKYSAQKLQVLLIEAEGIPEISEKYGVTVVPTFITCVGNNVVQKLEGPSPSDLSSAVKKLCTLNEDEIKAYTSKSTVSGANQANSEAALREKLERLIHTAPVMLFMKGSPAQAKCGFSRKIVEILQTNNIPFASFDILTDEEVRSGLKTYSDWPTYPQLYVKGTLIGGLDIVKEMAESGDLKEQLIST